jgi:hypothetical protein
MTLHESSAPKASDPDSGDKTGTKDTAETTGEQRKKNFFERKRFVDYEQNEESDKEQKDNKE